jgi:two-component system response regulator PilR (NtrC family)
MERAVALGKGSTIGLGDLPPEIAGAAAQPTPALIGLPENGCNIEEVLGEVERRLVLQALERSGGVRTGAAKLLGVTLRSLRYRLQQHALGDAGDDPAEADPPDTQDAAR